jgi:hypothetical protein
MQIPVGSEMPAEKEQKVHATIHKNKNTRRVFRFL